MPPSRFDPVKRSRDCFLPLLVQLLALRFCKMWFPGAINCPVCSQLLQPGKCRNEIDTAIVVDRSRQRLDIGTLLNHSEVVAKPLYQRSGNRHAAFQSVACGAIAKFVPDSGEEAKTRRHQPLARVHQQKATCAVGVLDLARTKTRLAD